MLLRSVGRKGVDLRDVDVLHEFKRLLYHSVFQVDPFGEEAEGGKISRCPLDLKDLASAIVIDSKAELVFSKH